MHDHLSLISAIYSITVAIILVIVLSVYILYGKVTFPKLDIIHIYIVFMFFSTFYTLICMVRSHPCRGKAVTRPNLLKQTFFPQR